MIKKEADVFFIQTPLTEQDVISLKAGDRVLINGIVYAARDAAHKRMVELLNRGDKLPFDIKGQIIYYVGPTPPKPAQVIGSAGPTTSSRMDTLTPPLLREGLKATIGKGQRSPELIKELVKYKAIYLAAIGGAGALLSKKIKKVRIVAWEDLGPEALREMEFEQFPAVVINDVYGNDFYKIAREKFTSQKL